jgi:peptidoglycan/LPS O-acetylase OafA/YrhL
MRLSPAGPAHRWTRLEGVEVLRGLAIFSRLRNHVKLRLRLVRLAGVDYTRGLPGQLVSSLVENGQFGVQIFSVVSGFLISSTTLRPWSSLSRVTLRGFYRLRVARIAPEFVLVEAGSASSIERVQVISLSCRRQVGLGRGLLAAFPSQGNVLEARGGYLPGSWDTLWSLSAEE